MDFKLPDQETESEESLLATLIIRNKAIEHCLYLSDHEFYQKKHQDLYKTISGMLQKKEPVDLSTLTSKLKKENLLENIGGVRQLMHLVDNCPMYNTKQYVKNIKEAALTREVKAACMETLDLKSKGESLLSIAQNKILNVISTEREDNIKNLKDIIINHLEKLEQANINEGGSSYKIGFPALDNRLRIMDGKLIIIAGRPGQGKTSMAVTIARNMDKQGVKVGFLSIEMPEGEVVDKWLSMESNVDSGKLNKYDKLSKEDLQNLNDAAAVLYDSSIKIDSTGSLDIIDVERKCRKLKISGCQVVFIDQLSQIGNRQIKAGESTALYSENCTRLSRLKKELGIPIFLLHQLNRSMKDRANKDPILTDLKQSGRIEEDADIVIFIHRPEEYETRESEKILLKGKTKIIIAKNRAGATYIDKNIIFNHELTYFYQGY